MNGLDILANGLAKASSNRVDELELELELELAEARAEIERLKKISLTSINNAIKLSDAELKAARRLRRESSPEALESERAANAQLTEELERKDKLIKQISEILIDKLDPGEWNDGCGCCGTRLLKQTEEWKSLIAALEAAERGK